MSRRKPAPEALPSARYRRNQSVKVICTDRGQHASTVLYHLTDVRGVVDVGIMWPEGKRNGSPIAPWTRADGITTYRFSCPACPRDHQMNEPELFRLLDGLGTGRVRSGDNHPVVDISLLP